MASTPFPAERFILKTLCRQSFFRRRVTAVTWVNHYFDEVTSDVIRNGMVYFETSGLEDYSVERHHQFPNLKVDSAIIILNKPPRVSMKGRLTIHSSTDVLAATTFSYGIEDGPKLDSSARFLRIPRRPSSTLNLAEPRENWNSCCPNAPIGHQKPLYFTGYLYEVLALIWNILEGCCILEATTASGSL